MKGRMAAPVSTRWSDTDPRALEVFIDLHRRMPVSQKVAAVMEMSEMVLRLAASGVRQRYPQASEREVFLRMTALHLDRYLMIRVYGWHPDLGIEP